MAKHVENTNVLGVWEVYGKCMGGVWEVSGRCMGGVWEVYGRWMGGGVWDAYGRRMGGVWERCMGGAWETQICEEIKNDENSTVRHGSNSARVHWERMLPLS